MTDQGKVGPQIRKTPGGGYEARHNDRDVWLHVPSAVYPIIEAHLARPSSLPSGTEAVAWRTRLVARTFDAERFVWEVTDKKEVADIWRSRGWTVEDLAPLAALSPTPSGETVESLLDVLTTTRSLVGEGALMGFVPTSGDWAERLYANQGALTRAIKALASSSASPKGGIEDRSLRDLAIEALVSAGASLANRTYNYSHSGAFDVEASENMRRDVAAWDDARSKLAALSEASGDHIGDANEMIGERSSHPSKCEREAEKEGGIEDRKSDDLLAAARAIANALGYDFDTLYEDKAEWISDRGSRHDINTPFRPDFVEAAIAVSKREARPTDDGWQDFATAPTDGSVILAYRPDAGVFQAHYVSPADIFRGHPDHESDDCEPQWWTTDGDDLEGDLPTHWRPLPPAPEVKP